jgi:DNA processing protein
LTSPLSATPHALIRDGAILVRDAWDLLEDLGFDPSALPVVTPVGLPDDERSVLAALVAPMLPETIARAAGMKTPAAVAALVRLELRGIVRASAGRYERTLRAIHVDHRTSGPQRTASAI